MIVTIVCVTVAGVLIIVLIVFIIVYRKRGQYSLHGIGVFCAMV